MLFSLYDIGDRQLIKQALTHKSFSADHNERLEFIGDAVLDLIIGEALYQQFPNDKEGILSRYRAELVKGIALAEKARELGLPDKLRLGAGEIKSNGQQRDSILAGAYEAVIGALYLEGGYEACKAQVIEWFDKDLKAIAVKAKQKDAKTALQEYLQSKKIPLPKYQVVETTGLQHQQSFRIKLHVQELTKEVEAVAPSKKKAEQLAAEKMLESIGLSSSSNSSE